MSVCNDTWVRAKVEQRRWIWTGHSEIKTRKLRGRAKDREKNICPDCEFVYFRHE